MDKLREEFEKWFLSEMEIDVSGMRNEDPSTRAEWPYAHGAEESSLVISVALKAWQASRASIMVEIPDSVGIECNVCADVAIKRCEESIRSIGLSIKGK